MHGQVDRFCSLNDFSFLYLSVRASLSPARSPLSPYPQLSGQGWVNHGTSLPWPFWRPDLSCAWEMLGFFISLFSGFRMLTCSRQPVLMVRLGQIFLFQTVGLLLPPLWDIFIYPAYPHFPISLVFRLSSYNPVIHPSTRGGVSPPVPTRSHTWQVETNTNRWRHLPVTIDRLLVKWEGQFYTCELLNSSPTVIFTKICWLNIRMLVFFHKI